MSLLEDVFLEDEAGEAQELERVIEGDDLDDRPRSPDSNEASEKEDEAEEDKRIVDHTAKAKRAVKNPRFVLNPARLTGPRGIQIIPDHFKDFKFKGKGHERQDLDYILKKLEHWAYRLYPKFKFDDCLKKIETLGKKRPVMVHLHKIRTDQFLSEEIVQQQDSSGDEAAAAPQEQDEFDRLLQQQIELARSTPAPSSVRKDEIHTPVSIHRSSLMAPKASSSPSISDEQKERMIRNRKLAEERRLARFNQSNNTTARNGNTSSEPIPERMDNVNMERADNNDAVVNNEDDKDAPVVRKQNRTNNVINSDSSDDENDVIAVEGSVTVDVHDSVHEVFENTEDNSDKENTELETMAVESEENVNSTVPMNINKSSENNKESTLKSDPTETIVKELNVSNQKSSEDTSNAKDSYDNKTLEKMSVESSEHVISANDSIVIDKCSENNKKSNEEDNINNIYSPNNKSSENTSNSEIRKDVRNNNDSIEQENVIILSSMINQCEEIDEGVSAVVTEELMDVDFSDDF